MIKQPKSLSIPINELLEASINGYQDNIEFPAEKLKKVPLWRKFINERRLKKMINNLLDDLEPYIPELKEEIEDLSDTSSPSLLEVKEIILAFLKEIDQKKLLFDKPFLTYFISQGYMDVAEAFMLRAKKQEKQLSNEEIFQALRNIWIMNSLQLHWGIPLNLTTPMYAYSMLYPYTDNLLDDPEIEDQVKKEFNHLLSKALAGEKVTSSSPVQSRVFSLVEDILKDYPEETHPGVIESIQLIHDAQIGSLKQTAADELSEAEILRISLYKGGTSVLADAYLIKGSLNKEEMLYAFHYGAFLQLLDDLQDIQTDKEDNNQTLFSKKQSKESVDQAIRQLISYIYKVNSNQNSDTQTQIRMKEIISRCTLLMIMESVGKNPDMVTSSLYKELESFSKVRLTLYKKLENKLYDFLKQ